MTVFTNKSFSAEETFFWDLIIQLCTSSGYWFLFSPPVLSMPWHPRCHHLIEAFTISCQDHCNSLLPNWFPVYILDPLELTFQTVVIMIFIKREPNHIILLPKTLQWLSLVITRKYNLLFFFF